MKVEKMFKIEVFASVDDAELPFHAYLDVGDGSATIEAHAKKPIDAIKTAMRLLKARQKDEPTERTS